MPKRAQEWDLNLGHLSSESALVKLLLKLLWDSQKVGRGGDLGKAQVMVSLVPPAMESGLWPKAIGDITLKGGQTQLGALGEQRSLLKASCPSARHDQIKTSVWRVTRSISLVSRGTWEISMPLAALCAWDTGTAKASGSGRQITVTSTRPWKPATSHVIPTSQGL